MGLNMWWLSHTIIRFYWGLELVRTGGDLLLYMRELLEPWGRARSNVYRLLTSLIIILLLIVSLRAVVSSHGTERGCMMVGPNIRSHPDRAAYSFAIDRFNSS